MPWPRTRPNRQLRWAGIVTPDAEHISEDELAAYAGWWIAPGSPYRSMNGALRIIRYAREHDVPLLGTCGGYQHVVLEYARNVLGFADAAHAEYELSDSADNPRRAETNAVTRMKPLPIDRSLSIEAARHGRFSTEGVSRFTFDVCQS